MYDGVDPATRGYYGFAIVKVALHDLDTQSFQLRSRSPTEPAHGIAASRKLLDDVLPEKAGRAGDENLHLQF
jgi:hypothetical protein